MCYCSPLPLSGSRLSSKALLLRSMSSFVLYATCSKQHI
uniref:Uncharacterized protein n=1 Tax=Arundo donax TaxID=35708 RepID=A0A0A9ARB2_ARUDO